MKLLEEIQAMRTEPGELMICWLGQAGVCLKDAEGRIVYVDPYFTNCGERMRGFKRLSPQLIDPTEVTAAYYITTHTHFDHFDFDGIPQVAANNPTVKFIGPRSCMEELRKLNIGADRCVQLDRGETYENEGIRIHALWADHGTMAPDAIGILLEMEGHRIYFSGDTAFHEELFRQVGETYCAARDTVFPATSGRSWSIGETPTPSAGRWKHPKAARPGASVRAKFRCSKAAMN